MIQNHVHLLLGKVHAVPTLLTETETDAALIICYMCLRSGDCFPDVLVVDHDSNFTSKRFRGRNPRLRQERGLVPHRRL